MKHPDCRNYAPVDVVKGICHVSKQIVSADDEGCEKLYRMPKCKFCDKFAPSGEEHLGKCAAVDSCPVTYPDLSAVNCESFGWKKD